MSKITISLKDRKKRVVEEKRGPILPYTLPGPLPRRLSQTIQIYDTGLTNANGELSFRAAVPGFTMGGLIISMDPLPNLAAYTTLYDEIFTVPLEDFASTYHRLTLADFRSDYYRMAIGNGTDNIVSQTDDEFTNNGVKIPANIMNASRIFTGTPGYSGNHFDPPGFLERADLKGGVNKITATRDYSAPSVVYTPRNGDKWFFMPTIMCPHFHARNADSTAANNADLWFDQYRPIPRMIYLDSGSPYYGDPIKNTKTSVISIGDGYAGTFAQLDAMRSVETSPQGWRYTAPSSVVSIDPDIVPDPVRWPPGGPPPGDFTLMSIYTMGELGFLVNKLQMAAQQGNDWYYFWRTA